MILSYICTEKQKEIYNYFILNGIDATITKYELSRARIYQIKKLVEHSDIIKKEMGTLYGLSIKTYNSLKRVGINNKKSLKNFYLSKGDPGLKSIRNIGETAIKEIIDFIHSEI